MSAGDFFGILNTLYVCRMFKTPDPWRSLRSCIQTLDPMMKTSMYTRTRNHQREAETRDPTSKNIMYQVSYTVPDVFYNFYSSWKNARARVESRCCPPTFPTTDIPKCPRQLSKALNTFDYEFNHWSDVLRFYRSSDGCIVSTISIADLPTAGGEPSRMQQVLYRPLSLILITQRARLAG